MDIIVVLSTGLISNQTRAFMYEVLNGDVGFNINDYHGVVIVSC